MSTEISEQMVGSFFGFLASHKGYYLVSRSRIEQLPQSLRGYTSWVTPELLDSIGMPIPKARGEIYFFTSENAYFRGAHQLKEREDLKGAELSCLSGPPGLLLDKTLALKPKVIHVDLGSQNAIEVGEGQLSELQGMSLLARYAQMSEILILQDRKKNAIELPLDDEKLYAIAFTGENESKETVKSCQEEFPGCHIAENPVPDVLRGILRSKLEGLVINPGSTGQITFDKNQLRLLEIGVNYLKSQKVSLVGLLKRAILPK
jgi:hypothetical protein